MIELARRGFDSVGTVRSSAKARAVHQAARKAGVEVRTVLLDVTDGDACRRAIDEERPCGLVNNAGYSSSGAIEDVSDAEARRALETMVLAPMRLARLAIPHMREAGGGRIVNISSVYGRTSTPLTGWYQGCKHALEGLSDALRMEVASSNIKVVLIEPGGFRTGIWEEAEREMERHAGSRYRSAYRRSLTGVRLTQPIMGDPQGCARVIAGAVQSRNPNARYLVGLDAQAVALYERLVPTMVKDRLARVTLGL